MHQKKVIRLLTILEERELTELKKYLAFSLPNESPSYQLFEYIYRSKNNWTAPRLKRERVIRHFDKGWTSSKFEKIISALVKAIEGFLVFQQINRSEKRMDFLLYLGEAYKEKGLYKDFKQVHLNLDRTIRKLPVIDRNYHLYQLKKLHQFFYSKHIIPNEKAVLETIQQELYTYYQTQKLYYEIETIGREKFYGTEFNKEITTSFSKVLAVLKELEKLVKSYDVDSFEYLEAVLMNQTKLLSPELAYVLLTHLINSCSYYIREGDMDYVAKLSDLFNFGLTTKVSLYNGKLSEKGFLNVIDCHSKTHHKKKVLSIIKNCAVYVNSNDLTSLQNMARAIYYFSTDDYASALKYTNQETITKSNMDISIRLNIIHLCSSCSLNKNHIDPETVTTNTKRFLRKHRKKLSPTNYLAYENLFKIVGMIWKASPNYNRIKKYYDSCKFVSNRDWIEKALTKLEKQINKG